MEETTIFDGRITCIQPRYGFRFSVDALLLSHFFLTNQDRPERFCELGAGCGVVSLLLARAGLSNGVAIERDPTMAEALRLTLEHNQLGAQVQAHEADVVRLGTDVPAGGFDVVLANPPYFPLGQGRVNPEQPGASARHELTGTMADFLSAARYLLPPLGRVYVIYPVARLPECLSRLPEHKLRPVQLQLVHQLSTRPASHFLLCASKSGGPTLEALPPLVVRREDDSGYGRWYDELLWHVEE